MEHNISFDEVMARLTHVHDYDGVQVCRTPDGKRKVVVFHSMESRPVDVIYKPGLGYGYDFLTYDPDDRSPVMHYTKFFAIIGDVREMVTRMFATREHGFILKHSAWAADLIEKTLRATREQQRDYTITELS